MVSTNGDASVQWIPLRCLVEFILGRTTPLWLFAVALVPTALLFAGIVFQGDVPLEVIFRDTYFATLTAPQKYFPPYYGLASNVGALLWTAAAAVALFSGLLARHRHGAGERALLLLAVSGFSALLGLDDLFLLHEQVYPRVFGLKETAVFPIYALLLVALIGSFWRLLGEVGRALLLASLAAFALGVASDVLPLLEGDAQRWGEDGFKLVGIACWATWAARLSWILSTDTLAQPTASRSA